MEVGTEFQKRVRLQWTPSALPQKVASAMEKIGRPLSSTVLCKAPRDNSIVLALYKYNGIELNWIEKRPSLWLYWLLDYHHVSSWPLVIHACRSSVDFECLYFHFVELCDEAELLWFLFSLKCVKTVISFTFLKTAQNSDVDRSTMETTKKIDIQVASLKTLLESVKLDTIKYLAGKRVWWSLSTEPPESIQTLKPHLQMSLWCYI